MKSGLPKYALRRFVIRCSWLHEKPETALFCHSGGSPSTGSGPWACRTGRNPVFWIIPTSLDPGFRRGDEFLWVHECSMPN